jgi:hypothetical protein
MVGLFRSLHGAVPGRAVLAARHMRVPSVLFDKDLKTLKIKTHQELIRLFFLLERLFDLAATSKLCLSHRSVPPPPAGFAGVGRGEESDLWRFQ